MEIAKKGKPKQKAIALETLAMSERFRGQREAIGGLQAAVVPTGERQRTIYDVKNGTNLPGVQVRSEGAASTGDIAVDEAYDGAGATYDLFYEIYERNSIDDRGMRLDSTVHYGMNYDNAFWNGNQMVYGDGDGDLFNRFTIAIDVIGHELTHGITQYEANLTYRDQPGALNESFSDVFGTMVKQRALNQQANEADWLIGEGLFTSNVNGEALRSMKAPGTAYNDPVIGKDPQPAHMRDYAKVSYDNGGVHINSGIPNHAFYLVATEIGGYAWEKAGMIWYIVLRERLSSRAQFQDAANMTYQVAAELYGNGSTEQQAVKNGWNGVGISVSTSTKGRRK
ncbi:MAG: M4 family metallopeptidase [Candidatus Methanoperedens sp.]|nr:M4 family metallopeptidase [Candidatus Methanoperedens sp.]